MKLILLMGLPRKRQKRRLQQRERRLLLKKIILRSCLGINRRISSTCWETLIQTSVVSALKSFQITWCCPWYAHTNNFCWQKRNVEKSCFLFCGFGSLSYKWHNDSFWWLDRDRTKVINAQYTSVGCFHSCFTHSNTYLRRVFFFLNGAHTFPVEKNQNNSSFSEAYVSAVSVSMWSHKHWILRRI